MVWTGREYIVWGGEKPSETSWHADGAALNTTLGAWRELAESPLTPRSEHVAVWTGTEMIICCGRITGSGVSAAAYDADRDKWREIATPPVHATFMEAIWTGEEMVVFGGVSARGLGQHLGAAAYDPVSDTWRTLADLPTPLERTAEAVLGDGAIYAWPSSFGLPEPANLPLRYDIKADEWSVLEPPPPESTPISPSLTWTGSQLIAWGLGPGNEQAIGVGVAYEPEAGTWISLPPAPVDPSPLGEGTQASQAMAWTGDEIILWTGWIGIQEVGGDSATALLTFNPDSFSWATLPAAPIPARGFYHDPIIWTGTQLLLYGESILAYTP